MQQNKDTLRRILYGDRVDFDALVCDHIEAGYPIAGFWATVNFQAQVEWEPTDYQYSYRRASSTYGQQSKLRQWYAVLGVDMDADEEQIRQAYRELARQFHPDLNTSPDATDRMQEINQAYRELMRRLHAIE